MVFDHIFKSYSVVLDYCRCTVKHYGIYSIAFIRFDYKCFIRLAVNRYVACLADSSVFAGGYCYGVCRNLITVVYFFNCNIVSGPSVCSVYWPGSVL